MKHTRKCVLSALTAVVMLLSILSVPVFAEQGSTGATLCGDFSVTGGVYGTDFEYQEDPAILTIKTAAPITVSTPGSTAESPSGGSIRVSGEAAQVTLAGVHMSGSHTLIDAKTTLYLQDTNTLHAPLTTRGDLTITGDGTLTIATSASTALGSVSGTEHITITGSATVVASAKTYAIGGVYAVTISQQATVSATGYNGISVGSVHITGGAVIATGTGSSSSGIGCGSKVTISGGNAPVGSGTVTKPVQRPRPSSWRLSCISWATGAR